VHRSGFETRVPIPGNPRFVVLRAVDRDGKVLGRSRVKRAR
jgi:hypothetical protein